MTRRRYTRCFNEAIGNSDDTKSRRAINELIDTKFGAVNDTHFFLRNAKRIATPQQIQPSIDQLFCDADVLSSRFQDLMRCWMSGIPNISPEFCHQECNHLFALNTKKSFCGQASIGPIKQITRSISKIHRSYGGNFRFLTDLVSENSR